MRFVFCGGLDCPDWLLAATVVLSKLSSLRLKVICNEIVKQVLGQPIEWPKVMKIATEAKLETFQLKQVVNCIEYVLTSAVRFNVDEKTLGDEMTMIGLPKESADQLSKAYATSKDKMHSVLAAQSLRMPTATDFEWRVDYVLDSSSLAEPGQPVVALRMQQTDGDSREPLAFEMSVEKFRVLYHELKTARDMMGELDTF